MYVFCILYYTKWAVFVCTLVQVDLYAQIGLQHYPLTQEKNRKKISMLEDFFLKLEFKPGQIGVIYSNRGKMVI